MFNKKQKQALKEIVSILKGIRGDFGSTTQKGFDSKIDEKEADLALTIMVDSKLISKKTIKDLR